MSSLQVPSGPREGKSDTDGDNKESDLFEANRRVPEVLCKIQTESEKRSGLYEQLMKKPCNNTSVSMSSSFGMLSDISDKLKQATSGKRVPVGVVLVAGVAAAFAAGLGIERPSLRKQHQSKET